MLAEAMKFKVYIDQVDNANIPDRGFKNWSTLIKRDLSLTI
jgi:hypothetical protein